MLENVLGVLRVYDEVTEFILKNLPEWLGSRCVENLLNMFEAI